MPTDDDIHDQLVAIHNRLGVVEGRISLIARSQRGPMLEELEKAVRKSPSMGHIYLELDGERGQREISKTLIERGVSGSSEATVSRTLEKMVLDHGIAVLVRQTAKGKVYNRSVDAEKILGLSRQIPTWLDLPKAKPRKTS